MLKQIEMKVIPHQEQRYDTLGDYWEDENGWHFRVSDLGDWRYNFSVLLHEFIEYAILKYKGISEEKVLAFDLSVKEDSPYFDDPGFDPKAPYHYEHVLADTIERLISIPMEFEVSDPWKAAEQLPKWEPKKSA